MPAARGVLFLGTSPGRFASGAGPGACFPIRRPRCFPGGAAVSGTAARGSFSRRSFSRGRRRPGGADWRKAVFPAGGRPLPPGRTLFPGLAPLKWHAASGLAFAKKGSFSGGGTGASGSLSPAARGRKPESPPPRRKPPRYWLSRYGDPPFRSRSRCPWAPGPGRRAPRFRARRSLAAARGQGLRQWREPVSLKGTPRWK